jgi:hypothetical protein
VAGKNVAAHIRTYASELRKEVLAGTNQADIKTALDVLNNIQQKLGALA